MNIPRGSVWCTNLRIKCFLIGYMHLIASIIDIAFHVAIIGYLSGGFQCDISEEAIASIELPWLEPFLLVINLGTHGFYPFPLMLRSRNNVFIDYMPLENHPKCYPGMFHINLADILNFMINIIWLKFVRAYVISLHKKDPEPMRMFCGLYFVKLVLQILYFSYQPEIRDVSNFDVYWFIKLLDIAMAALFLLIIYQYMKQIRQEKAQTVDQPPPYVECLMNGSPLPVKEQVEDKKETAVTIPEEKANVESTSAVGRV